MGSSLRFGVICVALVSCGGKKGEAGQDRDKGKYRDVPIRIAFGDCTNSPVPFVSGPRPLPLQADEVGATAYDILTCFAGPRPLRGLPADEVGATACDGVPRTPSGQPNPQLELDKPIIRRYIKQNLEKIQHCYEEQLRSNPKLVGTVNVEFFIAPSGRVTNSTASGVDPEVASCVADVIKSIEFPKSKGGGVHVNYPFNFHFSEDLPTAPASPAGSGAGSAAGSDFGSVAAPPPPPPVAGPYQPSAHNPLRQVEPELAACLHGASFGAMIVDLELDPKTGQATKAAPGTTDTKLAACIAAVAKTVKLDAPGSTLQRCGFAYGVMPATAVPTIAITATGITFNGTVVDHPSNVLADSSSWKIAGLFEALDAWQKQQPPQGTVPIRGPGLIEPLDQTPMKIVTNALSTARAAAADFVLATLRGQEWVPLRGSIMLPVAPVPLGSSGTWNEMVISCGGRRTGEGEYLELSVLVAKEQIWVGLSRINEFQEITGRDFAKLEQVLKEHKASAFFADRSDVEIAGEDDVVYGDIVKTIDLATKVGFTDWKVLPLACSP